jgi:IclR family transcriptional regulator, mhp operon transcriptional activator
MAARLTSPASARGFMDSTRPIRALMRGLEALTVLNLRDGATVSEVAHEIRLPRTTVYRILETLCDSGFVYRDAADERYRLTILVRGLSAGFDDAAWVTQIARPCLFELGESIVWPLSIATLSGTKLTVREATDHHSPLASERHSAGMQLPLLTTSAGHAYLACCTDGERAALLETLSRSKNDEDGPARDRGEFERLLAQIRGLGYASATQTRRLVEELSISVPVPLQDLGLAVLTVRFVASALPLKGGLERFLPKLHRCAAKISATFSQTMAEAPPAARADSMPRTAA